MVARPPTCFFLRFGFALARRRRPPSKRKTETQKKENENETKSNDDKNDDSNNSTDIANTATDEQERIIRDIKAIIRRDTDESSSETETKHFLNTTNDTMSITDESFETNESINDTETEASED